MDKKLSRRVDKIEQKLQPEKGYWLRFPNGKGGFIEVPGCRSIADVAALAGIGSHREQMNETERK